jgi:hypothetical protein
MDGEIPHSRQSSRRDKRSIDKAAALQFGWLLAYQA